MDIAHQLIERECSFNEILYTPHDLAETVYILKRGQVTLYHSHKGKKKVINTLYPGDLWGAVRLGKGSNYTHFAQADSDSLICMMPIQDFLHILQSKPEIMLKFLEQISEKLHYYEQSLKGPLLNAEEKVLAFIERHEKSQNLWNKILHRKPTHDYIAAQTGLARETVSRILNKNKR